MTPDTVVDIQKAFAKNRAEEYGQDVWAHFVVPPFYNQLDLKEAKKSRIIIGGRGCGKTMLLRYLSHRSTFSPQRPKIPADATEHIGLYWRMDTQFARAMTQRGIQEDVWDSAFTSIVSLFVGKEIVSSLHSIAESQYPSLTLGELQRVEISGLEDFDSSLSGTASRIQEALDKLILEFSMWVSNARTLDAPVFFPGRIFLGSLIDSVRVAFPFLSNATFYAYVDEFENLLPYQQRILNTQVKHSEAPLVFNLAMKRNGFATKQTTGEESIIKVADYRTEDIEELLEAHYDLFAAEVLFLNLWLAGFEDVAIDPSALRSVERIGERAGSDYKQKVLRRARHLLPGVSMRDMASSVFVEASLRNRWASWVKSGLADHQSGLPAEQYLRKKYPEASVVCCALIARPRNSPSEVLRQLDLLEAGKDNKFTGAANWIHNNLNGCLLYIYEAQGRPCDFYSGFDTFCRLSRRNMRHFLELSHRSVSNAKISSANLDFSIQPSIQALAAHQVATAFLGEIRSFGRLGNRLHNFVLWLGQLFALSQKRSTQSEPEVCHFSIGGSSTVDDDLADFLKEACKWSVLFEEPETKVKDVGSPVSSEYVLNPIYAPYFNISYRKVRRLQLDVEELETLTSGSYDEVKRLLRGYSEKWNIDPVTESQMLLSHLFEE